MRVTTRTNLAVRILMYCACNPGRLVTTAEISRSCNCSAHHAAHVVQQLHATGNIVTLRGRGGGIRLAKPMDRISIGSVMRQFEANIPIAECFDPDTNTCPLAPICRLHSYLARAQEAFFHELDMVTLQDLVQGNCGLSELLGMRPALPRACASAAAS
ncbi:MAG: transcriptional regulator [Rhodobacterales bacterium]|nr:MAG: transcriptional regulator [Rhodobacterales bacterium]